jgi:hypothetical protein
MSSVSSIASGMTAAMNSSLARFQAAAADIAGGAPALRHESSRLKFSGRLEQDDTVFFSEGSAPGWHLTAGGRSAPRRSALGWANAFTVRRGGAATLSYRTSPGRPVLVLVELALWVVAIRYLVITRRRRA